MPRPATPPLIRVAAPAAAASRPRAAVRPGLRGKKRVVRLARGLRGKKRVVRPSRPLGGGPAAGGPRRDRFVRDGDCPGHALGRQPVQVTAMRPSGRFLLPARLDQLAVGQPAENRDTACRRRARSPGRCRSRNRQWAGWSSAAPAAPRGSGVKSLVEPACPQATYVDLRGQSWGAVIAESTVDRCAYAARRHRPPRAPMPRPRPCAGCSTHYLRAAYARSYTSHDGRHFFQVPSVSGHYLVWYAGATSALLDLTTGAGFDCPARWPVRRRRWRSPRHPPAAGCGHQRRRRRAAAVDTVPSGLVAGLPAKRTAAVPPQRWDGRVVQRLRLDAG